jgi:hypothetical protein
MLADIGMAQRYRAAAELSFNMMDFQHRGAGVLPAER